MPFGEARTLGFNNVPLAKLIVANTIINKNGLFFYNGTPARGSLFLAITNIAGTDAFGNIYAQGFNIGKWSAVTGVQQQHYGLDVNGFTYVVNSAGKTVINEQSTDGSELFYDTNGQSLGHLISSIAPANGTDLAGNNYNAGIVSYDNTFGGVGQLLGAILTLFSGVIKKVALGPAGLNIFNASGALIYDVNVSKDAWFLYADTGSATQGRLIASSASAGGVDQFGNVFQAGVTSYIVVTGTFAGTYAVQLDDQGQTWGATVAAIVFTNLTNQAALGPAVTAQSHSTAGNNLNLQSGKTGLSTPATIQVQDSTSSSTVGGLVDVIAGKLTAILPDGNTYRTERLRQVTTATQQFTLASAVLIAGLSLPLGIGTYHVDLKVFYIPSGVIGSSHNVKLNFTGTATANVNGQCFQGQGAGVAPTGVQLNAGTLASTLGSPTHVANPGWMELYADITVTVAGTLSAQITLGVAGDDITTSAGTFWIITPEG